MRLFGIAMTVAYLGLGSLIFFDKTFLPGIPSDFRNIFAGMLLVYGAYRGWRIIADHSSSS